MMRPDGKKNTHGGMEPEKFPARNCIIGFCNELRGSRDPQRIRDLPQATGAAYRVLLHRGDTLLTKDGRSDYFADFDADYDQLVFLDPDNGFEPKKCTEQHVRYGEVAQVLDQVTEDSIVSVFQHFRYVRFVDDFAAIRERLGGCHSTAIYWSGLIFVAAARSRQVIERVRDANRKFAEDNPVRVII